MLSSMSSKDTRCPECEFYVEWDEEDSELDDVMVKLEEHAVRCPGSTIRVAFVGQWQRIRKEKRLSIRRRPLQLRPSVEDIGQSAADPTAQTQTRNQNMNNHRGAPSEYKWVHQISGNHISKHHYISELVPEAPQVQPDTRLLVERWVEIFDQTSLICRGCQHIVPLDRGEWIAHYKTCSIIQLVGLMKAK